MKIVIFGGTSAMAQETARCFARDGAEFLLVARSREKLAIVRDDLIARGATEVETAVADLSDISIHGGLMDKVFGAGVVDVFLVAYGILGDQKAAESCVEEAERILHTDFNSTVSILTLAAPRFSEQKQGVIAVIGSVAGDRGKPSNYVYGAAKAGLDVFLEGLRGRLHSDGVTVLTIKPGFVDTPMTAGIPKGPLFARAETAGAAIHRAIKSRRDIVYVPGYWRVIMSVIEAIPTGLFKRMRL